MSLSRSRKAQLSCERLDERCLPSVTAQFVDGGGVAVYGDQLANHIAVRIGGDGSVVVTSDNVVVPIEGQLTPPFGPPRPPRVPGGIEIVPIENSQGSTVQFVTVQGMGGDDRISTSRVGIQPPGVRVTVYGDDGNDTLIGGLGTESFFGGAGNDLILAGAGNNFIDAGAGDDRVFAGDGNDTVLGGAGNDTIDGGGGNDDLRGGLGNDTLKGGPGSDRLSGGPGADTFVTDGLDLMDFNPSEGDTTTLEEVPVIYG